MLCCAAAHSVKQREPETVQWFVHGKRFHTAVENDNFVLLPLKITKLGLFNYRLTLSNFPFS